MSTNQANVEGDVPRSTEETPEVVRKATPEVARAVGAIVRKFVRKVKVHVVHELDIGYHFLEWYDGEKQVHEVEVEAKLDETFGHWDDRHRPGWVKAQESNKDFNKVRELIEKKMYDVAVPDYRFHWNKSYLLHFRLPKATVQINLKRIRVWSYMSRHDHIEGTSKSKHMRNRIWSYLWSLDDEVGNVYLELHSTRQTSSDASSSSGTSTLPRKKQKRCSFTPTTSKTTSEVADAINRLRRFVEQTKGWNWEQMVGYKSNSEKFWRMRRALEIIAGCWNIQGDGEVVQAPVFDLEICKHLMMKNRDVGSLTPGMLRLLDDGSNKITLWGGNTPLTIAAYCWDLGAFRYFMRKGYSIHDKNNLGLGPYGIAMDKGFHDLVSHMFFNVLPTSNDGKILVSLGMDAKRNKKKRKRDM